MKKVCLFILLNCLFWGIAEAQNDEKTNSDSFLAQAVLNGLKKDKFSVDLVKQILAQESEWFVMKCPICTPVSRAFKKYLSESMPKGKPKLAKSLAKRFKSTDKTEKQLALRDLIDKYVQQHYQTLQFTSKEKANMEKELLSDRKQGMANKSDSFGKFCPSCDGATGKPKE